MQYKGFLELVIRKVVRESAAYLAESAILINFKGFNEVSFAMNNSMNYRITINDFIDNPV